MKIGIIDDGIDRVHPYFRAHGYRMPRGFPKGNRRFTDAKVIVARAFAPRAPKWKYARRPYDPLNSEHATHVAGIAAGNYRTLAGRTRRVSGVAPKAYLGNYKVLTVPDGEFGLNGNSAEIVAGIEAAVRDGMDVINLSLGEAEIDPSRDIVARALDGAAAAGVVPVVAAGNDYEELGAGSVASPGSSASAITAAAESQSSPFISSFSSGGPTPLSLRMKPDVTAPGEDVLSSVPRRKGLWVSFSGTSMASPHVAGAAALLRQRHRGWTVEQIKSALVLTGKPVLGPGGGEADTTREGGGTINLVRADRPLVFASPTSLAFGFVAPGGSAPRQVALSDAGGGAGDWAVSTTLQQPAAGASVTVLPVATVPGPLLITATASPGAAEASTRGSSCSSEAPTAGGSRSGSASQRPRSAWRRRHRSRAPGTYNGDTRGHPALVDTYRYPDDPRDPRHAAHAARPGAGVPRLPDAARSRTSASRSRRRARHRAARRPRGRREPAARRDRAPVQRESVPPGFGVPIRVAGAVLPAPGDYDVVFDSGTAAGSRPVHLPLLDRRHDAAAPEADLDARRTAACASRSDNGAGIDPVFVQRLRRRIHAGVCKLRRGATGSRRRSKAAPARTAIASRVRVSDYQESKNMENVPDPAEHGAPPRRVPRALGAA